MQEVYFGLKDNWWKQIYDAEFHQYGPEVFDKGLHEKRSEPGFFASLKKAFGYASDQLGTPLNLESYKKIHDLACEHFTHVDPKVINVTPENIEKFRNTSCECSRELVTYSSSTETLKEKEDRLNHYKFHHGVIWSCYLDKVGIFKKGCKEELDKLPKDQLVLLKNKFKDSVFCQKRGIDAELYFEKGNENYEKALQKVDQCTKELEATQKRLQLSQPLARFEVIFQQEPLVKVKYLYSNPTEVEEVLKLLIDDFNTSLKKHPKGSEEALKLIAEFFQNLEWLHPFFDGQGRTDLVVLGKLLTENGFNPSILYDPYFSSFEPLSDWVQYLKEGIVAWKQEK